MGVEVVVVAAAATTMVVVAAILVGVAATTRATLAVETTGSPPATIIGGAISRATKDTKGSAKSVKKNHIAKDCDWRYADDNSQKKKVAAAADMSYGVDTN